MKKYDKKKLIISAVCAVCALSAAGAAIAFTALNKGPFSGTVTESGTGAPLANISVTDGRNVVKTDEKGRYELEGWHKSHFVTVTVPSGYITEEYYIPVEKSVESYDFALEKSELTAREDHCFVQISDTEIGENGTGEWLDDVRNVIKENDPAFLIHTGDICYEAGLKKHIEEMNTDTMGCTVKYVIGNHDYVKGRYGEELYESLYGPVWYSFDVGNIHYVITSFQNGSDYKSLYNKNDRWRWLKNDLANVDDGMKVVMFNHTKSPSDDYVLSFDREELDLKKHNLVAWVFGHYHDNYVYESDGVLNISAPRPDCGGIDSSPAGTRVIHINRVGKITTQMDYYDLNSSKAPESALWSAKLEGNVLFCDTVYDSGFIYTATVDDDYPCKCGIYCINADSGETEWFFETANSVKNNIVISDNNLVAMDTDGNVYCLDKQSGTVLWERTLDLGNALGTSSGICVNDGIVFAGASRVITALLLENGDELWSLNRDKGENSPAQFICTENKLIVNSHWDALAGVDLEKGKSLWDNKDEDIRFRSSTPVPIQGNTLLVADDDAIMLVDSNSGEITDKTIFEEYSFSSSAQPAYRDGIAYIPTSNEGLVAFDVNNKKILWNFKTGESILFTAPYKGKDSRIIESSPILDGDNLIFGANDGCIYIVDINTGKEMKRFNAGSAVLGKAAVTEDKIYAGAFDGYIVCFEK